MLATESDVRIAFAAGHPGVAMLKQHTEVISIDRTGILKPGLIEATLAAGSYQISWEPSHSDGVVDTQIIVGQAPDIAPSVLDSIRASGPMLAQRIDRALSELGFDTGAFKETRTNFVRTEDLVRTKRIRAFQLSQSIQPTGAPDLRNT